VIVVLAHSVDLSAQWVAAQLDRHAREPVEFVSVEALADPRVRFSQRLGAQDLVELTLADGRHLSSRQISGVLNRLVEPPSAAILASPDGSYARNELTSFAASWVRRLGRRVINEPTPQGLSGRWRTTLAWRVLARDCGLDVEPLHLESTVLSPLVADAAGDAILVVDGGIVSERVPASVRRGVRLLATGAEAAILGVRFRRLGPAWRFLDATPHPDLTSGADIGVAAIARALAA
jgi:hypothetical protein